MRFGLTMAHDANGPPALTSALAEALAALVRAAERTHELLANRLVPALDRIAEALEQGRPAATAPAPDRRAAALAELRAVLGEEQWDQAEALLEEFDRRFPDDPETAVLLGEVARGRAGRLERLEARLQAARQAGDAEAVLSVRDELAAALDTDRLAQLDRELLPWLMQQIQRRMRSGTVGLDTAQLAAQVVERYGTTREGTGLRASLPILRRCAGLCPRCGEPYTGLDDVCPRCQAAARAPLPPVPPEPDPPEEPNPSPD